MTTGSARELDDDGQRTGAAVKASRLGDFFGWKALEEKFDASKQRLRQHPETLDRTRREIDRARSGSRNRKEFTAELRKNGIDAVFRENDAGRIYGVTFIDRTTHQVFNGSRLGKEYAADAFEAWFNGREQESSTPIQEELRPLAPLEPRGVVQRSGARVVHTHAGRVTAVAAPRTAPAGTIFGRRVRGVHRDPLRFDARRNGRTHGIYA